MAFDGITVAAVVSELNSKLVGGRVDKVYQPERDEIVILIRSKGQNLRLLLTSNASHPRIHLVNSNKDNPMHPPLFCMVLRKHLSGAHILSIEQPMFERIVQMKMESLNEMGDMTTKTLVIELMGKHSNIILTDENNMVLDAVKHVSHITSSLREVLPGKPYVLAPSQNKKNPLLFNKNEFFSALDAQPNLPIQKALYQTYTGLSPVAASDLLSKVKVDASCFAGQLNENARQLVADAMEQLVTNVVNEHFSPEVVVDEKNKPLEFSPFHLHLYEKDTRKHFSSVSEMLCYFYAERDNNTRISQKSQDLRKLVQSNIERCVKKQEIQQKTLQDIANRDHLKLLGELLTANLYLLQKGMKSFVATNFYDEHQSEIIIPLDPNKTPSENAQKYFKRYNKEKRTFLALQDQIKENNEELTYLEGVLTAISTCNEEADLNEIRDELAEEGFVKKRNIKKGTEKQRKAKPMEFLSGDGFAIFVGKNNKQNDALTLKFAMPDDVWLHTKEIPGSHVIIRAEGKQVPDTTIEEAANLAALFSKAKNGSLVPVDYTLRKHVKKPNGAKPGFVIYDNFKTAFITPDESRLRIL